MTHLKTIACTLLFATALSGSVYAADSSMAPPNGNAAMQSFSKLSKDGGTAFRDIALARLAIYNADPKKAGDLVGKADAALGRAKTDHTAFMKAEADLKTKATSTPTPAADARTSDAAAAAPSKTAVAWLPVDGSMALAEDFVATPQKAAAIKEANEHLAKGHQKEALERLKLEGIDVSVTTALLPLDSSAAGVHKAGTLIGEGKFYEANAALKGVEDGLRFDTLDMVGTPKAPAPDAAKPSTATTPQAAAAAKTK